MKLAMPRLIVRHSILLLVAVAMLALALISLAGMSASVMVAESVQGSASAINHAGALRRLTHRAASLVIAGAPSGTLSLPRVEAAIADFERVLEHPELQRIVQREPGGLFAATYRGVESAWRLSVRSSLKGVAQLGPAASAGQIEALLGDVDRFVDQLNTLVFVLEQDTEARIGDLSEILAGAIIVTLVVIAAALVVLRASLLKPLGGLLAATRAVARGDYSARVEHVGHDELGRVGATFNLMAGEISRQYQTLEQRVAEKTLELQRSNRALELLYHAIARLYQAPTEPAGVRGHAARHRPRRRPGRQLRLYRAPPGRGGNGDRLDHRPLRRPQRARRRGLQRLPRAIGSRRNGRRRAQAAALSAARPRAPLRHAAAGAAGRPWAGGLAVPTGRSTVAPHRHGAWGRPPRRAGAPAGAAGRALGDRARAARFARAVAVLHEDPDEPAAARAGRSGAPERCGHDPGRPAQRGE
ncbi:HAMP domain-containing protein [Thauera sp. SDU_THAU2]|uniref:HAMP domain-containing protein n=1 Tax=Thauera sp. SDU_THAU2 TaxID=3136633 RepID=UPI00311D8068